MSRRGLRANCVLEQEARWRVQSGLRGADGGGGGGGGRGEGGGPQDGWRCCGCESLYRKNQPQWKLKPRRSLTHHAHSRAYRSPVLSISPRLLALYLAVPLALSPTSSPSLALSRFYPISRNLRPPTPRRPLPQPNGSIASYSILGSTQLQRNRRALSWETKLRRNSFANRCRCGAKTPGSRALCDYSHPANASDFDYFGYFAARGRWSSDERETVNSRRGEIYLLTEIHIPVGTLLVGR